MEELFQKGIAPATERLYGAGARRYSNFCKTYHRQPIPATEGTLCMFVAHLTREGLSHGTAKSYLSAVRNWQVKAGFGDPKTGNMPRLGQTLKGLQRLRAEQGVSKRQRKPMTLEGLETLRRSWSKVPGGGDARMLWAAATLCFFGFTRSGELTSPSAHECDPTIHLQWEDVTTDCEKHPTQIRVRIKASKTDQLRQGCTLVVGCTDDMLCPVRAVLGFMRAAGRRQGPLFQYESGRHLTRDGLVAEMKAALERAGVNSTGFSGHSFRIGAATAASQAGIGDATIQRLGRWKSNAYKRYVQPEREELAGVPRQMVTKVPMKRKGCTSSQSHRISGRQETTTPN